MNIGIDLGSRTVKVAYLGSQGQLLDSKIFDSISFYSNYRKPTAGRAFTLDLAKLGLSAEDSLTATGYGKHGVQIEGIKTISEQKAHMLGAIHQTGLNDFVLLDIGGQDTKIVKVVKGKMVDVYMNDKCGASSGRYLENMAGVLKISLEELSGYFKEPQSLNNTCAVFGESEVLSKIFEGVPVNNIAAGVNYSVFERVSTVLSTMVDASPIVFVGGVSKNKAIYEFLQLEYKVKIIIPQYEQLNGAIGAGISEKVVGNKENKLR